MRPRRTAPVLSGSSDALPPLLDALPHNPYSSQSNDAHAEQRNSLGRPVKSSDGGDAPGCGRSHLGHRSLDRGGQRNGAARDIYAANTKKTIPAVRRDTHRVALVPAKDKDVVAVSARVEPHVA